MARRRSGNAPAKTEALDDAALKRAVGGADAFATRGTGTAARLPGHTPEWSNPNEGDPGTGFTTVKTAGD